jgi:hypothetical protein
MRDRVTCSAPPPGQLARPLQSDGTGSKRDRFTPGDHARPAAPDAQSGHSTIAVPQLLLYIINNSKNRQLCMPSDGNRMTALAIIPPEGKLERMMPQFYLNIRKGDALLEAVRVKVVAARNS